MTTLLNSTLPSQIPWLKEVRHYDFYFWKKSHVQDLACFFATIYNSDKYLKSAAMVFIPLNINDIDNKTRDQIVFTNESVVRNQYAVAI